MKSFLNKILDWVLLRFIYFFRWYILKRSDKSIARRISFFKRVLSLFGGDIYLVYVLEEARQIFQEGGRSTEVIRGVVRESDPEYLLSLLRSSLRERKGLLDIYYFDELTISDISKIVPSGRKKRILIAGSESEDYQMVLRGYRRNIYADLEFVELDSITNFESIINQFDLVEFFTDYGKPLDFIEVAISHNKKISLPLPSQEDIPYLDKIGKVKSSYSSGIRIRNFYIYYHPVQKAKELIDGGEIGYPFLLELTSKIAYPCSGSCYDFLWKYHFGTFSIISFLLGELEDIDVKKGSIEGSGSLVFSMKFSHPHTYGYDLINMVPDLKIKSEGEKIANFITVVGADGLIMINRGEGQLVKSPPLILRARNFTHIFEDLKDQWEDTGELMAEESVKGKNFLYSFSDLLEDINRFKRIKNLLDKVS